MPLVLVPSDEAHVLLVGHSSMSPEVPVNLLHFGGVAGRHLLYLLLHGVEEGAYLAKGLLVLTTYFGDIG